MAYILFHINPYDSLENEHTKLGVGTPQPLKDRETVSFV